MAGQAARSGQAKTEAGSPRLHEALRKDDLRGEKWMAVGQAGLSFFVLVLHVIAQASVSWSSPNFWVLGALTTLVLSSAARYMIARGGHLEVRFLAPLSVLDICVFLLLIWSYQYAYMHPAAGSLKAPSFVLLLALIALRAVRFHPRPILIVGTTAALGWTVLTALAVLHDGDASITHDYTSFLTGYRILIGAEIEKLVSIAAITLVLALATRRARQMLSKSAHAQDYADALAAARASVEIATRARNDAEQALASLESKDAELSEQNRRFTAALSNMTHGLSMFDSEQKLVVCNCRYAEMYGLPKHLALPGTPFRAIVEHRARERIVKDSDPGAYIRERIEEVSRSGSVTRIQELADGRVFSLSHRPMAGGGWVSIHQDITELQRTQDRIAHMAHHDALTDLPNRVLLHERISDALKRTRRGDEFAVLYLDIDRFKHVNDTLGHPVGDKLLKEIAARLRACVRDTDTVARLGGDEFAIIQTMTRQPASATALAVRIGEAIRKPFEIDGNQVMVDTSIGIAIAPADGDDADHLMKNADIALYGAKGDGRGVYRFFEAAMDARMKERRKLEVDLRLGLDRGEFELYYQPLYNLKTNGISGFEALLRWHHPERGVVSPVDFIPVAEEIGLIVPLGEWVIRTACAQASAWPGNIKVAVNLSAMQFKTGNLVGTVINALANCGLSPARLELEVTESVLLQDNSETVKMLHQLRSLGVRIAMDDFGTGYSSLSYLRSFPFDKIKIDRCFVKDLGKRDDAAAIVRAVAALAASLGMDTTAEGVEDEHQLERVAAEGFTEIQGYLVSPPVPAEQACNLVARDNSERAAAG